MNRACASGRRDTLLAAAVVVLAAFCMAQRAAGDEPAIDVTANRPQIYLGESLLLTVKVSGDAGSAEPDLSAVRNCRIQSLGSQSSSQFSVQIVNGRVTRQGFVGRTFTYELTPLEPGDFVAGPVRIVVAGKEIRADGPRISVTGIEKQDAVIVEVEASRASVLLDEPFDITLRILIRRLEGRLANVQPLDPGSPPLLNVAYLNGAPGDGLKGPNLQPILQSLLVGAEQPGILINSYTVRSDPFTTRNFFSFNFDDLLRDKPARFGLPRESVSRDGKAYAAYSLRLSYQPEKEDNYTFGPALFKGTVISGFDLSGRASEQNVFAVGPAVTVRVVPPPEEGQPPYFVGTLGSNLVAEATLDTQTCKVGDPLTLTLALSGGVRLDRILPPKLSLQPGIGENFQVYDDTVESAKSDGGRRYAYKLRPRKEGTLEVPPIRVAYYDVNQRGYRTVATAPIPIKVLTGAEFRGDQIISDTNRIPRQESSPERGLDSVAAMRADAAGAEPATLLGPPWLTAVIPIGPLLFLATLGIRGAGDARRRNAAARRRRGALPRAIEAAEAAAQLAAADPAVARRAAFVALQTFLSEWFDVPPAGLTPDDGRRLVAGAPGWSERADDLYAVMERLFTAGFAQAALPESAEELCRRAVQLLRGLRNVEGHGR